MPTNGCHRWDKVHVYTVPISLFKKGFKRCSSSRSLVLPVCLPVCLVLSLTVAEFFGFHQLRPGGVNPLVPRALWELSSYVPAGSCGGRGHGGGVGWGWGSRFWKDRGSRPGHGRISRAVGTGRHSREALERGAPVAWPRVPGAWFTPPARPMLQRGRLRPAGLGPR